MLGRMDDFVLQEPHAGAGGEHVIDVRVPPELKTLNGHFPGDPIVPVVSQVLLVERGARLVWPDLGEPSAMVRLKFMQTLRPGDELSLDLKREQETDVRFRILRKGTDEECSRGVLRFTAN